MKGMNSFLVGIVFLLIFAGFVCAEDNDTNVSFENESVVLNESIEMNETIEISNTAADANESVEANESIESNETSEANESVEANETVLVNESVEDVIVQDVVIDDIVIDDVTLGDLQAVVEGDSAFDSVVSYVKAGIAKFDGVDGNLLLAMFIVLIVLVMLLHSIFYGELSAAACFSRAASLHKRAERAHVNGDYEKAKRLYSKSYLLREKGEKKVSGSDDDDAV